MVTVERRAVPAVDAVLLFVDAVVVVVAADLVGMVVVAAADLGGIVVAVAPGE